MRLGGRWFVPPDEARAALVRDESPVKSSHMMAFPVLRARGEEQLHMILHDGPVEHVRLEVEPFLEP